MSGHASAFYNLAARRFRHGVAAAVVGAIDTLLRWQELASQRRALLNLDPRMLADIGVSRADALREAARPFWDDPLRGQVADPFRRAAVVKTLPHRCEC